MSGAAPLVTHAVEAYDRVLDMTPATRIGVIDGISALALDVLGDVTAVLVLTGWLALALDECEQAGAGAALDVLARVQARLGSMS